MLTEFQRRKLTHLFGMSDADKDGVVERADYARIADNFARTNGVELGTPGHERVRAAYLGFWNNLQQLADGDHDGKVTLAEYLAAYEHLLVAREPIVGIAQAIIALVDADRDGRIVEGEYVALLRAYDIAEDGAREAFRRLDRDGDGAVTADELLADAEEFFYGDNPDAPGNWLLGPL
jgi:Ca2+-binding EF-hand superfamily protein